MLLGKKVIIHGDGTSLWSMMSSFDFAIALSGLVGNSKTIGEAFQIASEDALTWNQIYEVIADALGVPLRAIHISSDLLSFWGEKYDFRGQLLGNKAHCQLFDNSKLKAFLPGFNEQIKMKEGIHYTVKNVLKNNDLQKEDLEFDMWCDCVIGNYEKIIEMVRINNLI